MLPEIHSKALFLLLIKKKRGYAGGMRVVMVSKADRAGGGASQVAETLTSALNAAGHETLHVVSWRGYPSKHTVDLYNNSTLFRIFRSFEKRVGLFEYTPIEIFKLRKIIRKFQPDIVHFHDISSAYSVRTIAYFSRRLPTFWTFHDMSPVTGGCLYPGPCLKYLDKCGGCPQIGKWPIDSKIDGTKRNQAAKRRVLRSRRIQLGAPSVWMQEITFKAIGLNLTVIDNGIVSSNYQTLDYDAIKKVRQSHNLNPDKFTILLAAADFSDERKGGTQAIQILNSVANTYGPNSFQLIVLGDATQKFIGMLPKCDFFLSGFVSHELEKAKIFQTADLFLYTSLEDNQPLTVLQALTAGLQIVGFDTGGVAELQKRFINSIKTFPMKKIDLLISEIGNLMKNESNHTDRRLRQNQAAEAFDVEVQLNSHLKWYVGALNDFN
jgi:glycosyltransferase involved in cell wall biosynthesis